MGGVFVRGGDYWQKASKEALDEHAKAPLSPVVIQELYPWVLSVEDHFQEPLADYVHMSCSLNSFKEGYVGDYMGEYYGVY